MLENNSQLPPMRQSHSLVKSSSGFFKLNQKSDALYKVNKRIVLKNEELPFTNTSLKPKNSVPFDTSVMQQSIDILQKTSSKIAFPPNRHPLTKIQSQPSLGVTHDLKESQLSRFADYNRHFKSMRFNIEEEINKDIVNSIRKQGTVVDYYKTYGYFYTSKTSQNYANTIPSLANNDRSQVNELDQWFTSKVDKGKAKASDYRSVIQSDKAMQDPDQLLKNKQIQNSEILEATTQQLRSVIKQKQELFQPGKPIKLKPIGPLSPKAPSTRKSSILVEEGVVDIPSNGPIIQLVPTQLEQEPIPQQQSSEIKQSTMKLPVDDVIKPLTKKQMWEVKEKATTVEVKLQYTKIKLEEKLNEMKSKLCQFRKENAKLTDKIKNKYTMQIASVKAEIEFQNQIFNEGLAAQTAKTKSMASVLKKAVGSRLEDFMRMKAIRDDLQNKKESIENKVTLAHDKIKKNTEEIKMLEFEVNQIKRDIELTVKEQLAHYQSLLKEGIDSRKDGLIWVIKAIWLLGFDVHVDHLPRFMDSECIKFILEYAKLDIKRCELHSMLKELKLKARQDRINQVFRNKAALVDGTVRVPGEFNIQKVQSPTVKSENYFKKAGDQNHNHKTLNKKDLFELKSKETILKSAKERLHTMAQTLDIVVLDSPSTKDFEMLLRIQEENEDENSKLMDNDTLDDLPQNLMINYEGTKSNLYKNDALIDVSALQMSLQAGDEQTLEYEIQNLERRFNHIKNKMKKLKSDELERLAKEFLMNNYEIRFKVQKEVLLNAILGEDRAKNTIGVDKQQWKMLVQQEQKQFDTNN